MTALRVVSSRRQLPALPVPAVLLALALVVLASSSLAALQATPGKDGAGGTLTGIVNAYWPGSGSAGAGATSIAIGVRSGAAQTITAGDLLLVIQMQGADIDSSQSGAYGDGVAGAPGAGSLAGNFQAGRYEYVIAQNSVGAGGGTVSIVGEGAGGGLVNSYLDAPAGAQGRRTFQVVRVPQYTSATLSSSLTASRWNGSTGGVLAIDVEGTLSLGGNVDVSGRGFRGGGSQQRGTVSGNTILEYRTNSTVNRNASKGEGTAGTPRYVYTPAGGAIDNLVEGYPNGSFGVGAPGNAGGGGADRTGQDHNAGGGGGGNAGVGGRGGRAWNPNTTGSELGGFGGAALPIGADRLFLGGGGGAGSRNDSSGPDGSGGAGGGIVAIRTGSVSGSGTITANGARGFDSANEGSGGGGSGGSVQVIVYDGTPLSGLSVSAEGGDGGDAWPTQSGADPNAAHGAGGGGGGGQVTSNVTIGVVDNPGGADGTSLQTAIDTGSDPGETNGLGGQVTIDPEDVPGTTGGGDPPLVSADLAITKSHVGDFTVGVNGNYTIEVSNDGPDDVTGTIVVTDLLPGGLEFVSASGAGWSCGEAGGTVTCTRTGLADGASASITLVVSVNAAAAPSITNTATVTGDAEDPVPGNDSASDPTVVFDPAPAVDDGVKPLYLNISDDDDPISIQRALPVFPLNRADNRDVSINNSSGPGFADWPLTPALASELRFDGARQSQMLLYVREQGGGNERSIRLELLDDDDNVITTASVSEEPLNNDNDDPTAVLFTFAPTSAVLDAGDVLTLRIRNTTGTSGCDDCGSNRRIRVFMQNQVVADDLNPAFEEYASRSRLLLATNVINVDSVEAWDDSFANGGGALVEVTSPGEVLYLRAVVSDPFGTFDIREATITVTDALGDPTSVTNAQMVQVDGDDPGDVVKIYETVFVPNDPPPVAPDTVGPAGDWTVTVRADEGVVDEWDGDPIFHVRQGSFELGLPDFVILKSSTVVSDPVNTSNPKRIPGSVIRYTIQVSNQGRGRADTDRVVITDNLPAGLELAADSGIGGVPVAFLPGSSGLSIDQIDCTVAPIPDPILFEEGASTTTTPTETDGYLLAVTAIVVNPCLRMDGNLGGTPPSFSIIYRTRVP